MMNKGRNEMSAAHFSLTRIAMGRHCARLLWSESGGNNLPFFPVSTQAANELYPAGEMHFLLFRATLYCSLEEELHCEFSQILTVCFKSRGLSAGNQ